MAKWRVVGISFDHMHMGDLLRQVAEHGDAEIAGIYDPSMEKMAAAIKTFGIESERVFTDLDTCLAAAQPDLAILCSATGEHASYVERIARRRGLALSSEEALHLSIGRRIRDLRKKKGLTLKQTARRTNLSVSLLSQIERAESSASVSSLFKVAIALEVKLTELFGDF